MAHFGAKIRALRIDKQITLPALADRAKISKGLLSNIETDEKSNPSLSTLYKIADGLGLTIADITDTERVQLRTVAPDPDAAWRKQLAAAFKGRALDPAIVETIQYLRNRKAEKRDDLEHWKFLYHSIENSFKE